MPLDPNPDPVWIRIQSVSQKTLLVSSVSRQKARLGPAPVPQYRIDLLFINNNFPLILQLKLKIQNVWVWAGDLV